MEQLEQYARQAAIKVAREVGMPEEFIALLESGKGCWSSLVQEALQTAGKEKTVRGLSILAGNTSVRLRGDMAFCRNMPVEILTILRKDNNPFVRENVAQNPTTSKEDRAVLEKDENACVRWHATKKRHIPYPEHPSFS